MEYISKLVGSTSASPTRNQANPPQQRLIRFKKVHEQLQQISRRETSSKQKVPVDTAVACLESIKNLLQDEIQTSAPHLCARYVSTFRVYTALVKLASGYHSDAVIIQALETLRILIDSEEVEFLEEKGFADALIGFLSRTSTTGPLMVSVDTEGKIVEVLFAVAARLRLQPKLLKTWFRPTTANIGADSRASKDVFPLFYLTLDYVHHDGRVGDFARTGLLYLIESASHSEALERWIVESDLATLMASGLGALYSQLSRKLVLSFPKDSIPAIVSFSEAPQPRTPSDAEKSVSPDFQAHLATFLSYLVFWQDVLEHCGSEDVRQSLLDHFKFLFLQQLLYPSLIESSDVDGGSSVAVLTYLRCVIESIDHAELLHLTLQYLLAIPDNIQEDMKPLRPTTLAQRRKSQTLISNLAQGQEKPMPDLFTLVDLIQSSLQSRNQQTVTATLRLVSVLLRSQHQYAVSSIIKSQPASHGLPFRNISAHNRDTDILFTFAEDLIEHDDLGEIYETHLQDAQGLLEAHCCSSRLLALPDSGLTDCLSIKEHSRLVKPHLISPDDPLIQSLVSLLEDFLANDIGTNLSLTQAFSTLASCGYTRLDYWLLGDPFDREPVVNQETASESGNKDSDHDDTTMVNKFDSTNPASLEFTLKPATYKVSSLDRKERNGSTSPIFSALEDIVRQVEIFRYDIHEFDAYLAERRRIFRIGENIDKAVAGDSFFPSTSQESSRLSHSRVRSVPQIGSISQRLISETSSANVSGSTSPRGRQLNDSSSSTLVGRLNHLHISPSPSPSKPALRTFSPSPLQKDAVPPDSTPSTPPKRAATPVTPADALRQSIKIRTKSGNEKNDIPDVISETSSIRSESVAAESKIAEETREVTLSHLLTNIIILQEFILEIAAIVQVRASLFGEVKFI